MVVHVISVKTRGCEDEDVLSRLCCVGVIEVVSGDECLVIWPTGGNILPAGQILRLNI